MSSRYFIAAALVVLTSAYADAGQRVPTADSTDAGEAVERRAAPRSEPAARPAPAERAAPAERPAQRSEPAARNEPAPQRAAPRAEPRNQPRSEPAARPEPARPVRVARPAPPPVIAADPAPQPAGGSRATPESATEQERAVPRGSRPQGDNPRIGTAVPRGTGRDPSGPVIVNGGSSRPTVIVRRPPVYTYYYPQRYYPYGYGGFGLGYFYYDPYTWYPNYSYRYYDATRYGYSPGQAFGFDTGELRLRVTPRSAQVFIDGYYAGVVDDFDGTFQALRLEEGPYRIEIVAPGYRPLEFDVRIIRDRKITYRGDLGRP